jgi:hypothetical protein
MNPRMAKATATFVAMCAFAVLSWMIFRGYLTSDMLVYFLSFRWCF